MSNDTQERNIKDNMVICRIDDRAIADLEQLTYILLESPEFETDDADHVQDVVLSALLQYWLHEHDAELHVLHGCLNENEDSLKMVAVLHRMSMLHPSDYPDLFDSVEALRNTVDTTSSFYIDYLEVKEQHGMFAIHYMYHEKKRRTYRQLKLPL